MDKPPILVIKLGALGDFVQALGPMKAIRDHHPDAHITLLTTKPLLELAAACDLVDEIWLDDRPRFYQIGKWLALRARLQAGHFEKVYDLQTSDRSSAYFSLFPANQKPEWSGIAKGCSHPHANPGRDLMHTQDRQREQLAMAGIDQVAAADLKDIKADLSQFQLPTRFGLLVPGGAPHRPAKRWPAERYAELAADLNRQGITPVVLGSAPEKKLAEKIVSAVPEAIDLVQKTSLPQICALAAKAEIAIGNDTGPMHIAAAAGCPSVVLFSNESDPKLCAPKGDKTAILIRNDLADLALDAVLERVSHIRAD